MGSITIILICCYLLYLFYYIISKKSGELKCVKSCKKNTVDNNDSLKKSEYNFNMHMQMYF